MSHNQFNPSFVNQQGMQQGMLQQQHPSNQIDTTQPVPGLSNPEHGRMWQQMQQNPRIAQFRPNVGGEMGNGHANQQQMLEFIRNRNLVQNQQQAVQKQHQAPFGLGPMNSGGPSSFHDPSSQPGFPYNGNNMMTGGNSTFNINAIQAMAAARNQNNMGNMGMLQQTLQGGGSGDFTRQINMLGMAHSQRTQEQPTGSASFAALRQLHQQQQQQQQHPLQPQPHASQQQPPLGAHMNAGPSQMGQPISGQMGSQQGQPGFFGASAMAAAQNGMRDSPTQANMQVPPAMRPSTATIANGRLNFEDLKARAIMVQKAIKDLEARRLTVIAQGGSSPQSEFEANSLRTKIMEHQQLLQRIGRMIQMSSSEMSLQNGMQGPGPDMGNGNHMIAPSPVPQPQPIPPNPSMQGQQNWLPQPGPSPPNNFSHPHPHPQMSQQGMPNQSPQAPNMQPNPGAPPINRGMHGGSHMNGMPNRSMTTPHQMLPGAQNPPQPSPNLANMSANPSFAQPGTATAASAAAAQGQPPVQQQAPVPSNGQRGPVISPLPKATFTNAYKTWSSRQPVPKDERLLSWENRPIDLYLLHCEVIKLGGFQRATAADQWQYIGAKLGFVNFPATDTEPARAGPGIAQHLQHVYTQFLDVFDKMYISSMLARSRGLKQGEHVLNPQAPGSGPNPMTLPNNLPMQNGQPMSQGSMINNPAFNGPPPEMGERSLQGISSLVGITDPQQLQQLLKWSTVPNEQLRAQGVPSHLVDKVELHRAILQRTYQGQIHFQEQMKNRVMASPAAVAAAQRQRLLQNAHMQAQAQQSQKIGMAGPSGQVQPGHVMRPDMPPGMQQQMQMQQQQHMQHQQQQQVQSAGAPGPSMAQGLNGQAPARRARPSPEEVQKAVQFVSLVKHEYAQRTKTLKFLNVSEQEKMEYNTAFEQLYRHVSDMDNKMHIYASFMKEEGVRKLIAVIATAHHQRSLLSVQSPKYILDLKTVRSMTEQMQVAQSGLHSYVLGLGAASGSQQQQQPPQQPPQHGIAEAPTQQVASQAGSIAPPRPPTQQPQQPVMPQPNSHPLPPPQSTPIPTPATIPAAPPNQPHHQPQSTPIPAPATIKKKPTDTVTSTPPASAPTPSASAPTPTNVASSPQAAQSSPKPKATPKPKPAPRRKASTSKAVAQPATQPQAPSPAPSAAVPSSSAPTPVDAATPSSEGSNKRRREEEAPSAPAVSEPSPPKKLRTDWDGPVSEVLVQKEQEMDNINSDEDASKFLEKMSEMLRTDLDAGSSQEPWPSQISDIFDQILKAYPDRSDLGDPGLSSLLGDSVAGLSQSPPPGQVSSGLDGFEFFDFSSYSAVEDDSGSKVATPDLATATSTNPSPRSGSETDVTHASSAAIDIAKIVDPKEELGDGSDLLRTGFWKEIDGGESAHYQSTDWKWDGPMPEQTWAFT